MDTQTKGTVVWFQQTGNVPVTSVTFYREAKPAVVPMEGFRIAYLGSKLSKDGTKQREKMAISVKNHAVDSEFFGSVTGNKFLQAITNDYQDSILPRVIDGELSFDTLNDPEQMAKDYFDSSRDSSGRKVSAEKIAEYFTDSSIALTVATRALIKNAQMSEDTVASVVKQYGELFGQMTKFNLANIYSEGQAKLIRILLDSSESDGSEMREWINERFAKIEAAMKASVNLLEMI